MTPITKKHAYSLPEACQLLSVGLTLLRSLSEQGKLPIRHINTKAVILASELEAYVESLKVKA